MNLSDYLKENSSLKISNIIEGYHDVVNMYNSTHFKAQASDFIKKEMVTKSLGMHRNTMPQIDDVDYAINHLKNRWGAKTRRVKLKNLKPSQCEADPEKIALMLSDPEFDPTEGIFFVDKDNRLADGHHRWAGGCLQDPEKYVKVLKTDIPAKKLLNVLKRIKGTHVEEVRKPFKMKKAILNRVEKFNELVNKLTQYNDGEFPTVYSDFGSTMDTGIYELKPVTVKNQFLYLEYKEYNIGKPRKVKERFNVKNEDSYDEFKYNTGYIMRAMKKELKMYESKTNLKKKR